MMRLKLISDGTVRGTRVVHALTDEPLEGVVSLVVSQEKSLQQLITVTVKVLDKPEPSQP